MTDEPGNGTVTYRLHSIEQRVLRLESLEPAVQAERIQVHAQQFEELREEIKSLKRALYTFAFSVATGAVVFAIGVMQLAR